MKELKLSALAANELSKTEMNEVLGGNCCGCGCHYASSGGSSTSDNKSANLDSNLYSGGDQVIVCEPPFGDE